MASCSDGADRGAPPGRTNATRRPHGASPPRMTGRHEGRPICRKKRFENISEEEKNQKKQMHNDFLVLPGVTQLLMNPEPQATLAVDRSPPGPLLVCRGVGGGRQDYSEPVHSHLSSFLFQFSEGLRTCHKNRKLFKHAA